jgi:hypothetical protein
MARNPDRGRKEGAPTVLTHCSSGWFFGFIWFVSSIQSKAKNSEGYSFTAMASKQTTIFHGTQAQVCGKGVLVRSYRMNLENKILLAAQTLLYHIHID